MSGKKTARYLEAQVLADLNEKMVFLVGPRQVGKTTLALGLPDAEKGYLNWDVSQDRSSILQGKFPNSPFWVFDEIHKYRSWRNFLKGLYDQSRGRQKILVTGSARLDLYRRGGDSLQGRYHFLRMYPLSFHEVEGKSQSDFNELLNLGGFPQPFFSQSKEKADRWTNEYRSRVVREEIIGLENVTDLAKLELLSFRLPDCLGSPISVNALSNDLELSPKTTKRWIDIFEKLYVGFWTRPFGSPKIKAVKKESKFYLFDWNSALESGPRFENLVAVHLLKWCHFQEDVFGKPYDLRYFRDTETREVDFVVTLRNKPEMAIEAKWSDTQIHPALRYFKNKFPAVRAIQILADSQKEFKTADGIEVLPARKFLGELI